MSNSGPLDGITVLDFTLAMAGPFAAQKLGDMGADVIKVEPTGTGEWHRVRAAGNAWENKHNSSFLAFNRNKRSLSIDLKDPQAKHVMRRAIANADVVIQNFRPGVAERLGIDFDSVSNINEKLIYCSISGYGDSGPHRSRPGQDLLLQGMSGAMWNTGSREDPPLPMGMFIADATAAHLAVEGVLAALIHRGRSGVGQKVNVNLFNGVIDLQAQELSVYFTTGKAHQRSDSRLGHTVIAAPYGVYETADSFIVLSMGTLEALAEALDRPELANFGEDAGFTDRDALQALVSERLKQETTETWLERCEATGYWAGPVYTYDDLAADEQVKHNEMILSYDHPTEGEIRMTGIPIEFSETPGKIRRHQPEVGEQSVEVLMELGFSREDITQMAETGVIQAPSPANWMG